MARANQPGADGGTPPLTTETVKDHATKSFKLLDNQTRMGILLALWEAKEPFSEGKWDPAIGNAVPFAELRDRVGISDSGQFNYHLGKLEGRFVEDSPEGYQLLPAGQKIVRAVIASAGFDEASVDRTDIDLACINCGSPTAVTYQQQRWYHVCTTCEGQIELGDSHPSNVLSAFFLSPAALRDRTPEEIHTVLKTVILHDFSLRHAGICSECRGRSETTLDVCEDHRPGTDQPCPTCGRQLESVAVFVCTVCKNEAQCNLPFCGLSHPAVISFFYERGIELGNGLNSLEETKLLYDIVHEVESDVISMDPPRVRIPYQYEGDELSVTLDEHLDIVDVSEPD